MAKHPYTHEMYLRSKGSRKRATDKWLSNPDNKQKIRSFQRDYYRQRYQNEPEYREYFRAYQRQYRKSMRSDLIRFAEQRERQREANKRSLARTFLKSVNGDLIKFAEYLEPPQKARLQHRARKDRTKKKRTPQWYHNRAPYFAFRHFVRNLVRKTNLVITYGERCAMRGENNMFLLQLHHINNDGGKERKEIGWREVIQQAIIHPNWNKFQLLCENCHQDLHVWDRFFSRHQ